MIFDGVSEEVELEGKELEWPPLEGLLGGI